MSTRKGQSAAWSGKNCTRGPAISPGTDYAVQGNMLVGEPTIQAMAEAFANATGVEAARATATLSSRRAGGGRRQARTPVGGAQGLLQGGVPYLDLRVDEHRHPVAELRRVFEVARHQLLPFMNGMPSRKNPLGDLPESVARMLLDPPPFRPGGGGSAP